MGAAFRIAGKDLRLRVRDRSVLILGIIAPLVLSYIFYLVFGPAATGQGLSLEYGLVDDDRSEISTSFTAVLEDAAADGVLELTTFEESAGATSALDEGDIDAYFHIPTGLGDSVLTNQTATIDVVGDVDSPTSTQIAASFAEQFSSGVASSQTAVATAAAMSGEEITPEFIASLGQDPASAAMSFSFTDETAATKQLDASTFFAAGMAVFFLFFTVQFGVTGLLEEERQGTLARLMAAPIARVSVIAGKAILAFILGVVSMAVLVVATTLLMEADWGAPLGVAILVIAGVLSAVGIMGLVASVARTPEGAGNLGAIIAVVLGMLGGTFFPIASSGGILANLTYLTPHAWFMLGLAELGSDAPWTAALPAAAAIMVFAVVTGGLSYIFLRRRLAR
jgi:ABC-2 type transport system permease protein